MCLKAIYCPISITYHEKILLRLYNGQSSSISQIPSRNELVTKPSSTYSVGSYICNLCKKCVCVVTDIRNGNYPEWIHIYATSRTLTCCYVNILSFLGISVLVFWWNPKGAYCISPCIKSSKPVKNYLLWYEMF